MKFCKKCGNMLFIKLSHDEDTDSEPKVQFYCRSCLEIDESISDEIVCVLETNFKNTEKNIKLNPYAKYDVTLPTINKLTCPNATCPSNKEGVTSSIKYRRYNENDLKCVYICTHCDNQWTLQI